VIAVVCAVLGVAIGFFGFLPDWQTWPMFFLLVMGLGVSLFGLVLGQLSESHPAYDDAVKWIGIVAVIVDIIALLYCYGRINGMVI
jgi:Kef-type K+ transport system membrane component KefB